MAPFHRLVRPLVLGLLLSLMSAPAHAQAWDNRWQWANSLNFDIPGVPNPQSYHLNVTANAITPGGEVYTAYRFNGPITFGTQSFTTVNTSSFTCVVAKYNRNGAVTGTVMQVTDGNVSALKVDAAGNLYALGRVGGQLTCGGQTFPANSPDDIFLIKCDSAGAFQWIQQSTDTMTSTTGSIDERMSVAIDGASNVTISVAFRHSLTFAGQPTLYTGFQNASILAQFSSSGVVRWVRAALSPGCHVNIHSVAAAPNGTLYAVGYQPCSQDFTYGNANVLAGLRGQYGFWLKIDSSGHLLEQRRFSSLYQPQQVASDAQGRCYLLTFNMDSVFRWGNTRFPLPPATYRDDMIVMRLTAGGNPEWVQSLACGSSSRDNYVIPVALRVVNDSLAGGSSASVYVGGQAHYDTTPDTLRCGNLALLAPPRFGRGSFYSFLLALEGDLGTPLWLRPVLSGSGAMGYRELERLQGLDVNARGEISAGGTFSVDTAYFDGALALNINRYNEAAYSAKMVQRYNLIQGTVFTDANSNGVQDTTETRRQGVIMEVQPGPTFFSTRADGQYSALAFLSTYTLHVPNPPRYHTAVATNPAPVTFSTYRNISAGHDFALQPIANQQDLTLTLTPVTFARPGFAVRYRLTAHNVGTVAVLGASLHLTHDPLLTFVSSSVPATATGSTLTCSLDTLQAGETRQVDVTFQLATTAPLGYVLDASATLYPTTGDLTPSDNTDNSKLRVTGSYDPNDITVNYATLTPSQVQNASQPLDYTVRFQNVGTDTAFSVTLSDTLPAELLNLATLQVLSASHPYTWRLGAGGVVTVSFADIRLPDSTTNLLESMGFVRLRLTPNTALTLGEVIPNRAEIYFDFNAPVATNTALTTIAVPTGLSPDATSLTGGAWPNPTTGALYVAVEQPAGAALLLTLTDALGRTVRTEPVAAGDAQVRTTLDVRGLAPGLYIVRAEAGGRRWSQRMVVR